MKGFKLASESTFVSGKEDGEAGGAYTGVLDLADKGSGLDMLSLFLKQQQE